MIHSVRKSFQFHAAHQIEHHEGECKNLHGHTYTVTIEAAGPIITTGPAAGMVIDFGDLKRMYRKLIHDWCDHAYLNDVFEFATTAENLSAHFLDILHAHDLRIRAVEVSEGPGNIARAAL